MMIFSEVIAKKMPIFSKYSICQPPLWVLQFFYDRDSNPLGTSVKQNNPVNCFVASGGEIGTETNGLGDEPRAFSKRESLALRQKPHCYKVYSLCSAVVFY